MRLEDWPVFGPAALDDEVGVTVLIIQPIMDLVVVKDQSPCLNFLSRQALVECVGHRNRWV